MEHTKETLKADLIRRIDILMRRFKLTGKPNEDLLDFCRLLHFEARSINFNQPHEPFGQDIAERFRKQVKDIKDQEISN